MSGYEPNSPDPSPSAGRSYPPTLRLPDARMSLGAARLDDLFPPDPEFRRSLRTFTVLLALAAFIASFGLYQDSVASIIGAMVVAPLGGAIMAFGAALVTARLRWQLITFVQVGLGALGVIAIGYLVSLLTPDLLVLTPSLEARTAPGILDLGVALAAGAAGAYVAVRRTGSDALPGVAIAVALVPPLATVGICLELGRTEQAGGALLLFLTNFAAITVSACVVFLLAGAGPGREMARERRRAALGVSVAIIALCIVAMPLAATGIDRATDWSHAGRAEPVVRAWLGSRALTVESWTVDGDRVALVLRGSERPGSTDELARALATAFGSQVTVSVVYTPAIEERAAAMP